MISVDTVYQRVLALANKEQRGYITPLEFNLLSNQAQLQIFEQYFYDLNQAKRDPNEFIDEGSFSDIPEMIKNKLNPFIDLVVNPLTLVDFYQVGRVFTGNILNDPANAYEAVKVDLNEARFLLGSRYHRAGLERNPIYCEEHGQVKVFNNTGLTNDTSFEVIRRPQKAEWGYNVVAEKALYNASFSVNFDLHESEETNLVIKTLQLSGVTINKSEIVAWSAQQDMKNIQQKKM